MRKVRGLARQKDRNIEIKTEVIADHPSDQIVGYAKEKNSDIIVIARKSKSKIEIWLLGQSQRAATYALCTVTIVK